MTRGLSVLTLVKNRSEHLQRLVEGLARSATRPLELIVVDMSDEPVSIPPIVDFPVTIVRLMTDALPLAQARNLAAQHAEGDHLLFLDVDCIPMADLVGRMDEELSETNALICAEVRYLAAKDVSDDWTEAGLTTVSATHPVRSFPAHGRRQEPNAGLFWSLTFGIRKSAFDAVDGFDEAFTGYGAEDTDFGFRCRDAGLPLLFIGGSGSFHQHHGVYDPPLQHFDAIIANARLFHDRWGVWAMDGWLKAFADLGLVSFDGKALTCVRNPAVAEIEAARRPPGVRF